MSNYKTYRDLHLWVGLILLLPVTVIAVTGFLWNHEKTLGIKTEYEGEKSPKMAVTETAPLSAFPGIWNEHAASIDAALAASQKAWGEEIAIEKIELKQEPGYGLILEDPFNERQISVRSRTISLHFPHIDSRRDGSHGSSPDRLPDCSGRLQRRCQTAQYAEIRGVPGTV